MGLLSDIRIVLLIACGLFITGTVLEHQRAKRYQVERNAARAENIQLLAAIKSKDVLVTDMSGALATWQNRATQSVQESTQAGNRAETYRTELSAARTRIRALMEADRGSIDCLKLMAIDIAAVCPSTARGVRDWANDGLQGPHNSSPGTGGSAHRPKTDPGLPPVE